MGYLDIPEWEIEEAIVRNPAILGIETIFKKPKLIGEQVYLPDSGRFIDMLFQTEDKKYVIVELKKTFIDDPSVIYDQLLPYKSDLSSYFNLPKKNVFCVLATTRGLAYSVIQTCKQEDIYCKHINEKLIYHVISDHLNKEDRDGALIRLFKRRYPNTKTSANKIHNEYQGQLNSIRHYIETGEHDDCAKIELASLLRKISSNAPLCAHEVFEKSYKHFSSASQRWFWIFYSVLDRRANAVTFINASKVLSDVGLFEPNEICDSVHRSGKEHTLQAIHDTLAASTFPLASDTSRRNMAMPTSIVEAALWYERYQFDSGNIRKAIENRQADSSKWALEFIKELKDNIYGVGDRIAGQIVRGFVLKDGWNWVTNVPSLLEKCDFNITFASQPRLGIVKSDKTYFEDLQSFGDKYLNGNYSIISHVLWYLRKRYCLKPKRCFECPVSGYCNYYYKSLYWQVPQYELTLLDFINFKEG